MGDQVGGGRILEWSRTTTLGKRHSPFKLSTGNINRDQDWESVKNNNQTHLRYLDCDLLIQKQEQSQISRSHTRKTFPLIPSKRFQEIVNTARVERC